jgi:hypothetical protein
VTRTQLTRILKAAERPNITVWILPFRAGAHFAMGDSLTTHTLPDDSKAAYVEGARYGRIFALSGCCRWLCSWVAVKSGSRTAKPPGSSVTTAACGGRRTPGRRRCAEYR